MQSQDYLYLLQHIHHAIHLTCPPPMPTAIFLVFLYLKIKEVRVKENCLRISPLPPYSLNEPLIFKGFFISEACKKRLFLPTTIYVAGSPITHSPRLRISSQPKKVIVATILSSIHQCSHWLLSIKTMINAIPDKKACLYTADM